MKLLTLGLPIVALTLGAGSAWADEVVIRHVIRESPGIRGALLGERGSPEVQSVWVWAFESDPGSPGGLQPIPARHFRRGPDGALEGLSGPLISLVTSDEIAVDMDDPKVAAVPSRDVVAHDVDRAVFHKLKLDARFDLAAFRNEFNNRATSVVSRVEGPLFSDRFIDKAPQTRWENLGDDEIDGVGWLDFLKQSAKKIRFDRSVERYFEVQRIVKAVRWGASPGELGIPDDHYRLRNVAEMQEVIEAAGPNADGLAAYSIRYANAWFYILFGNDSGNFRNMDMARYREIGAMQAHDAFTILPEFETRTFRRTGDKDTAEFGNSLSAENRGDLFKFYSRYFAPERNRDDGGD